MTCHESKKRQLPLHVVLAFCPAPTTRQAFGGMFQTLRMPRVNVSHAVMMFLLELASEHV
jgi:hypothetical protein